jgi:K+-sensing histidine kinase KdpD
MDQVTHGNPNIQLDLEVKRDSAGEWDRLLIRTALSTLLDGLVRRSRVGARLSVVVTREGEDAVMTVRAPTAVLPPRERLFDRDPSGEVEDSVFPEGDPAHPHTISYSHGIGLYVCRAILSAHGGSLELTEDAPEAVTFVARLPHAETVRLTVPKAAPPPRATTAPVP